MWTGAPREKYRQPCKGFPSDLTDAQWARLEPPIPPAAPGGRPRQTDMRAAMNALFYRLRAGCPWRFLPGAPFPLRSMVYNIFRKFQREGVWEQIWAELHIALREDGGREAGPTAGVIDRKSLKSAGKGAARRGVKMTQWARTPARR
jgi:transposase